jgi:predicted solute-binding protein
MKAVEAGNREMVEALLKGQMQCCNINLQEYVRKAVL